MPLQRRKTRFPLIGAAKPGAANCATTKTEQMAPPFELTSPLVFVSVADKGLSIGVGRLESAVAGWLCRVLILKEMVV